MENKYINEILHCLAKHVGEINAQPSNEILKPFTIQRKTKLTASQILINISTDVYSR